MNSVFDFDELICRQAMTPRKDIVMLDIEGGASALFDLIKDSHHSRYPVYEDSGDNVIGLVHVKDFAGKTAGDIINFRDHLRPIEQVPESMSLTRLLTRFQASKVHMALIADEYGSIIGVITLEDILEKLVGSIQDEFDSEPDLIKKEGKDSYLLSGSAPIELVNITVGLHLKDDVADTISGHIVDLLDRNPKVGDRINLDEIYYAEVLSVENARVVKLKIARQS